MHLKAAHVYDVASYAGCKGDMREYILYMKCTTKPVKKYTELWYFGATAWVSYTSCECDHKQLTGV